MGAESRAVALTIAGSDSGGGAGIQADLKTFERFGVFGTSALTLVTAQNTCGVDEVHLLPVALVAQQVRAVRGDLAPRALKIGATGSEGLIRGIAALLDEGPADVPVVLDPVMVSKHGAPLLPEACVPLVRDMLLPRAHVITPNVHEAALLLGHPIADESAMRDAARELFAMAGGATVVLKGGGLVAGSALDVLIDETGELLLREHRVEPGGFHGTGCTFSAAICAGLALGQPVREAVEEAKAYIQRAIATAPGLGSGHSPVNHRA